MQVTDSPDAWEGDTISARIALGHSQLYIQRILAQSLINSARVIKHDDVPCERTISDTLSPIVTATKVHTRDEDRRKIVYRLGPNDAWYLEAVSNP